MCGIAGWMRKKEDPQAAGLLEAMLDALQHRGPDGRGTHFIHATALGHQRLSVIDVAGGRQPFCHEHLSLVVDGEIYNYVELKEAFPDAPFQTGSDCEPLLFLYQRFGLDFIKNLRGMYALALYDVRKKELILARDSFGIKPLYYTQTPEGFFFASEITAFLKTGLLAPKLNPRKRDELLQLRFTTGKETPFQDIYRLLPGETLRVYDGAIVSAHIRMPVPLTSYVSLSEAEALPLFEEALKESTKLHLRSDVPYGLFLSGGIDSATLLYFMHQHVRSPIQTFTTTFPEAPEDDESVQARTLADFFGTDHHEIPFEEKDFWALLPEVIPFIDDPFIDYTALPFYKMAREAHTTVKVILCGEGADELLAGHRRYQKAGRLALFGGKLIRQKGNFSHQNMLKHNTMDWQDGLQLSLEHFGKTLFTPLQRAQGVDCETWLPNCLLTKLDRCLMAHGVEGRTPFLEPELSRFLFSLPDNLKIRYRYRKWLQRKWLKNNLPIARPFNKKQGFTFPAEKWVLKKGKALAPLLVQQPGIQEAFAVDALQSLFDRVDKKSGFLVWSLLFYALWHRYHVLHLPLGEDVFETLAQTAY